MRLNLTIFIGLVALGISFWNMKKKTKLAWVLFAVSGVAIVIGVIQSNMEIKAEADARESRSFAIGNARIKAARNVAPSSKIESSKNSAIISGGVFTGNTIIASEESIISGESTGNSIIGSRKSSIIDTGRSVTNESKPVAP